MHKRALIGWSCAATAVCVLLALIPVTARAASGGTLCLYGSDRGIDTGEPMTAGSSPAITGLPGGGAEVAYQSSAQQLHTYLDTTDTDTATEYGMEAQSSPAITQSGGTVAVAFAANSSDELWTGNGSSESPAGVVLAPGTSPSAAALSASSVAYAYEGQNSDVYEGNGTSFSDLDAGMEAGTSPAVTAVGTSGGNEYETAEQVNTTALWVLGPASDANTQQGMDAGTSPAITGLSGADGAFEVAFQANTNFLYLYGSSASLNTTEGMAAGTSPAITAAGSGYDVAFQANNGDLWLYGNTGLVDTGHAMAPGTSPAITATSAGYEVAYQCAPAAPPATATATVTTTTTTPAPVTSTTPSPGPTQPRSRRRIRAQFAFRITWNGRTSHVYGVRLEHALPRGSLVTFRCRGTRTSRCPRLGVLPRRHRTLARELAVVAGRTFRRNNVLKITVAARGYRTETIVVRLPGNGRPRYTLAWR